MKKIKNLFECYEEGRYRWVTPALSFSTADLPDFACFTATRKWDGTACMVKDGKLYARYDAKQGKQPPKDAIPCEPEPDLITGHWPHWVEVKDQPEYKWHKQTFELEKNYMTNGTYELIGEKINSNKEKIEGHTFKRHGDVRVEPFFLEYQWMLLFMSENPTWEGLVIYKDDQPYRKIRRSDFKELKETK